MPLQDDRKQKPNVPPLFKEIVEVQAKLDEVLKNSVIIFETAIRLKERNRELMRAAERALCWNVDKGNK